MNTLSEKFAHGKIFTLVGLRTNVHIRTGKEGSQQWIRGMARL